MVVQLGWFVVGEGTHGKYSLGLHHVLEDDQGGYWKNRGYSLVPCYVEEEDKEEWGNLNDC